MGQIPCSEACISGEGQGESDSQPFCGFLHAFLRVPATSPLRSAWSEPLRLQIWGFRYAKVKAALSGAFYFLTYLLTFKAVSEGTGILRSVSNSGSLTSLPSCINLGMVHFCKNYAVIFAFPCMPFIWRSQCAVQMFLGRPWCPLICFEIPGRFQSLPAIPRLLPVAEHTNKRLWEAGAPLHPLPISFSAFPVQSV